MARTRHRPLEGDPSVGHYTTFAPLPHTFGQYVLALGVAPVAGAVAARAGYGVVRLGAARR